MARKIEFNREEVLQKAMDIFWQNGYCKCSIASLVDATQLQPGSLYAAFKSKEGLFLATLEYYANQSIEKLQSCLKNGATPVAGIQKFIEQIGKSIQNNSIQRGCFLVNTVLELSHEETISNAVSKYFSIIESLFLAALESAQESGELSLHQNPEVLAKYLMINIWGLQVLARTNPDNASVRAILDQIYGILIPTTMQKACIKC